MATARIARWRLGRSLLGRSLLGWWKAVASDQA
jgi:hypothetical protein